VGLGGIIPTLALALALAAAASAVITDGGGGSEGMRAPK